ncbi:unnamed protein product [Cuscuta epithymum]|uniref:Uncharacterized protein n=1 Tax=Cuscuta epithymum TaxID=186058 RepID=A0AAV0EY01_9ASTE|nr:unnamed protein product [Cuscuta epithymum]
MQRERGGVHEEKDTSTSIGEKISSILGSLFGPKGPVSKDTPPDDLPRASKPTGPVIEELESNEDGGGGEVEKCGEGCHNQQQSSDWANGNPLVEHPEDQADDYHNETSNMRKSPSFGSIEGNRSMSYRRVTHGGINGAYLTATTSRLTGSDGRVWEETKHADTTTGEATHRISRGIHDKGHTVTRKLKSDGKVDSMETLHNLGEDDLVGFERDWKTNAGRDWKYNARNGGPITSSWLTNWDSPFREGSVGPRSDLDTIGRQSGARAKKVITINIE